MASQQSLGSTLMAVRNKMDDMKIWTPSFMFFMWIEEKCPGCKIKYLCKILKIWNLQQLMLYFYRWSAVVKSLMQKIRWLKHDIHQSFRNHACTLWMFVVILIFLFLQCLATITRFSRGFNAAYTERVRPYLTWLLPKSKQFMCLIYLVH